MQEKLAAVIKDLTEGANGGAAADYDGPRSPDMNIDTGAAAGWDQGGYTTPFGNGATGGSGWGQTGAATPYGATPYGQNGGGWN